MRLVWRSSSVGPEARFSTLFWRKRMVAGIRSMGAQKRNMGAIRATLGGTPV